MKLEKWPKNSLKIIIKYKKQSDNRQTDRQTDRQSDRQTDRLTDIVNYRFTLTRLKTDTNLKKSFSDTGRGPTRAHWGPIRAHWGPTRAG